MPLSSTQIKAPYMPTQCLSRPHRMKYRPEVGKKVN